MPPRRRIQISFTIITIFPGAPLPKTKNIRGQREIASRLKLPHFRELKARNLTPTLDAAASRPESFAGSLVRRRLHRLRFGSREAAPCSWTCRLTTASRRCGASARRPDPGRIRRATSGEERWPDCRSRPAVPAEYANVARQPPVRAQHRYTSRCLWTRAIREVAPKGPWPLSGPPGAIP